MENEATQLRSMYLSTLPNNKKQYQAKRSPLDVSDIQGARSRFIQHPKPQRDNPLHPYDLQKSHPRQLIPQNVNKTSYILAVDDIAGTRTKVNKFTTTRNTNPLNPQYQSPVVHYLPIEEPKFIKDGLAIDDIEGVRSRETFASRLQRAGKTIDTKQQITVDIKPTPKGFTRNGSNPVTSSLFAEDINKDERYRPHSRQTNPLEPSYQVSGDKGYGFIEGSRSSTKFVDRPLRPNNSLKNDDIEGAKTKYNNFVSDKKEDINGTKPQSLKRGISSNRRTDPLQPSYNYPGWTENQQVSNFTRPKTAHQKFDQFIK